MNIQNEMPPDFIRSSKVLQLKKLCYSCQILKVLSNVQIARLALFLPYVDLYVNTHLFVHRLHCCKVIK